MSSQDARNLTKSEEESSFSQYETIDLINLYYNSRFKNSRYDNEDQRKIFLNISKFRSDVASKMVDLDLKNFVFTPEDEGSQWPAWFLTKDFRMWAKDNEFSQLINDVGQDYPKYGTAVLKVVKGKLVRVPINNLRNTQDAESLDDADYVIEEHEYSKGQLQEIAEDSGWDIEDIDIGHHNWDDKIKVYERYGFVSEDVVDEDKGDPNKMVKAITVVVLKEKKKKEDKATGHLLFASETKKLPYIEVHWSKQDGRWLGIGEIENQFENQLSRNVIENLRRRALLWSSKKIFQTADDTFARNLLKDTRDGDILQIGQDGIQQVNMQTQSLADFAQATNVWEQNSNQKAFTYEVATGESLPSGTPFRLGVIISSAVKSHFELKRENLGLFFKKAVTDYVIPSFKKQNIKQHIIRAHSSEEGIDKIRKALIKISVNKKIKEEVMNGRMPDLDRLRADVERQLMEKENVFLIIPERFYEDIKYKTELNITGESQDIASKIETLKTIFQIISANPQSVADPNSRAILAKILGLTGENLDDIIGQSFTPAPQAPQAQRSPDISAQKGVAQEAEALSAQPRQSISL